MHVLPTALLLHGDMDQGSRNQTINDFKRGKSKLLVATDVAARGLDIPHIRTVVNYDPARNIDTHTHRIGRTGRAGTAPDCLSCAGVLRRFCGNIRSPRDQGRCLHAADGRRRVFCR